MRTPAAKVVAEGKTLRFPVTLSGASDKPITVRVATADGTATTADGDYTAVTEDVVFGPGETVKHVEVPTIRDTEQETEPETLDLRVTDAGGAVRSETPAATGSVLDATIAVGTQGVIAEGDSGVTEQYFAVLLNVDVDEEVRLNYQVLHDTTDDVDLDTVSGTLVFPPGTYQQFMVPIHGDTSDEGAGESFTIRLSGLTGVEATGLGDHRFRIVDDDGAPSIASVAREFPDGINPDVEDEGNTTETAPFTVELSHPAPGPIVLDVTGADQTAVQTEGGIAGADYSVPSSVTFEEGEKTKTFDVTINGDAVWEDTETAMIMVSPRDGDPNVIGDPAGAELRLENDDAPPALTLNTGASGTEGGTVDVIATPAGIAEDPIGYLLRLSGDTSGADPAEATDFTGGDVKVTVPGGGTGPVTLHSIKLAGDTVDEASESIEAVLEHPAAPPAEARYEIRDDPLDSPPAVSVGSVTAAENQGFAEVPVTLEFLGGDTTSTEQRVSAGYEVLGGSEDVAEPRTGIVEFGPGQTNSVIRVPIVDDKRAEPEGSVTVRVFGPSPDGVGINQAEGRIVITDDDKAVPAFAVTGAVTAGEASGSAAVEVSLSEPAPVDIDLDVAIGSGTATPSRDYGEPATTVRIPEGRSSALITVPIRQDEVYEGDETAVVTVSSAGGSSQQAAVTITDDDPEPTVTFAQTTATVAEGGSLEVRGTVTGTPQRDYVIGDGEATATTARTRPVVRVKRGERRRLVVERGPAVRVLADDGAEPADYDLGDGLVIPAGTPSGSTTTLGTIRFADDSIDEDDEIAELTVAGGVIRFRITDDPADRPPTVSIGDAAVSEDDDAAELPVTLDFRGGAASTERVVTVPWQTVDGTAEAGRDYRKSGGAVTIDPLAGSATVRVPLIDDTRDEKAQSFTVRLGAAAPAGVPVTGGPGTVTITDDDKATAPTLTAPATQAGSGRVVLSGVAAAGAKVELLSAGGVAGGTFKVIGTTVADDDGAYTFQPTIGIGVRFQTRAAGLSSPVRVVRIRQEPSLTAVSNARGQVTLTVAGDPDEGGQTVRVQRRIRGEWREVDDGRLGPRGRFATTVRGLTSGGTAVFRAVITATPSLGILAGTSASRTVKVK
ncbi:Calx-beta domain-containing protein [Actinoplanes utahensis]|uniref:Calx-beta domain-containing protein n=1 Tax=Actinoplanes utahensis TaxID=1869 RepID=UPI000A04A8F2|nr:Calx-beta domain-containing protein [Actinoplanes utahensis]